MDEVNEITAAINAAFPRVRDIPPLNTIEETAEILRIGTVKTNELLRAGRLVSVVIDGRRTITGESILRLMRASEQLEYKPIKESPRKRQKVAA